MGESSKQLSEEGSSDNWSSASFLRDDDDDELTIVLAAAAAACYYYAAAEEEEEEEEEEEKEKKSKTKKRCWVKDYRKTRNPLGNTQALLQEPKPGSSGYRHFLRMDQSSFDLILSAIRADIEKQDTIMRESITPEEKFSVTLRFLATGESFINLDYNTKLSQPFLSSAVIDVCEAIYKNLKNRFLKFPTTKENWSKIAEDYNIKWQFPNCLGALDGNTLHLDHK